MLSSIKYHIVTSTFTRANGFEAIESSTNHSKSELLKILTAFTPQGASPNECIRIRTCMDWIGISYFAKEDDSTYNMMVLLTELERILWKPFLPIMHEKIISHLAKGDKYKLIEYADHEFDINLANQFDLEKASIFLYSLLCGDDIIIVHPEHSERLKFIYGILQMIPSILFKYICITTNCEELDGNENIIGVSKLPEKYQSHMKLYLPLDTIFVDLNSKLIQGEGIKNSELTRKFIDLCQSGISDGRKMIIHFLQNILHQRLLKNEAIDDTDLSLVHRIEVKMGLRPPIVQDWMMF